jgi:ketosteroid isomerase-like protein
MDAASQVDALYQAYQARDWDQAARCMHPDAVLDMPATSERLTGREQVLGFQRSYPEPWGDLTVRRVMGGPDQAAAEIEIIGPDGQRFANAAFWRQRDGLLHTGVEYWVTVGGDRPPPGRPTAFIAGQGE